MKVSTPLDAYEQVFNQYYKITIQQPKQLLPACFFSLRTNNMAARTVALFLAENLKAGWTLTLSNQDGPLFTLPTGSPLPTSAHQHYLNL